MGTGEAPPVALVIEGEGTSRSIPGSRSAFLTRQFSRKHPKESLYTIHFMLSIYSLTRLEYMA